MNQCRVANAKHLAEPLRHLHEIKARDVGAADVRRFGPVPSEHHRHAPLRVVASRIVVAANLLPRRHVERVVVQERREAAVLRLIEAVERGQQRGGQTLILSKGFTRGLDELRALNGPVVVAALQLGILP